MPSASVVRFNTHPRPRRRRDIVEELRHARTQQYLEHQYPGRPRDLDILPQSEFSPWPTVYDDE